MTPLLLTPARAVMAPLRGLPTSVAPGEAWLPPLCCPEFAEQPPPSMASTTIPATAAGAAHRRRAGRAGGAPFPRLADTSVSQLSGHAY
jgi:hypothetical protein